MKHGQAVGNEDEKSAARERILLAAAASFSDKGYRGASIRLICTAAKVNVSAVKYYFGSKEKLYFETIRFVCVNSGQSDHWDTETIPELATLEEWRAYAEEVFRGIMARSLRKDRMSMWRRRMFAMEVAQPSSCEKLLRERYYQPLYNYIYVLMSRAVPQEPVNQLHGWTITVLQNLMYPSLMIPPMDELLLFNGHSQEEWIGLAVGFFVDMMMARLREIRGHEPPASAGEEQATMNASN